MKYVHIAGTNGKGSAAEYIYQIISAAGETCGLFTSPHLVSPTEPSVQTGSRSALRSWTHCFAKRSRKSWRSTFVVRGIHRGLLWFERLDLRYAVLETGLIELDRPT